MSRKHKDIPELDGEVQAERETDDRWENNSTVSFKTLKVYQDVIEDKKKANSMGKKGLLKLSGHLKQGWKAVKTQMEYWRSSSLSVVHA